MLSVSRCVGAFDECLLLSVFVVVAGYGFGFGVCLD